MNLELVGENTIVSFRDAREAALYAPIVVLGLRRREHRKFHKDFVESVAVSDRDPDAPVAATEISVTLTPRRLGRVASFAEAIARDPSHMAPFDMTFDLYTHTMGSFACSLRNPNLHPLDQRH